MAKQVGKSTSSPGERKGGKLSSVFLLSRSVQYQENRIQNIRQVNDTLRELPRNKKEKESDKREIHFGLLTRPSLNGLYLAEKYSTQVYFVLLDVTVCNFSPLVRGPDEPRIASNLCHSKLKTSTLVTAIRTKERVNSGHGLHVTMISLVPLLEHGLL